MKVKTMPALYNDITNKHAGKTAWILGSGVTLDETIDWVIPENTVTIALNGGVVWFWNRQHRIRYNGIAPTNLYRRRLDYWFCFDRRVSKKSQRPDYDYYNLAMRHPTAVKMIPEPTRINVVKTSANMRNIRHFQLDKNSQFTKGYSGNLLTGKSILMPTLHYCYVTGFKRVVLTGIDMCCLNVGADGAYHRYSEILRSMKWAGHHVSIFKGTVIAPNGELVRVSNMYNIQLYQTMRAIRTMQHSGVEVYKTSTRGMLDIPVVML